MRAEAAAAGAGAAFLRACLGAAAFLFFLSSCCCMEEASDWAFRMAAEEDPRDKEPDPCRMLLDDDEHYKCISLLVMQFLDGSIIAL